MKSNDQSPFGRFHLKDWRVMVPAIAVIVLLIYLAWQYQIDSKVIAGGTVILATLSGVFAWLVGVIGLIPFIGPLIVKILSIGFIWLLNAIGYLVAYIAIRRGYSQDVLTYRGLTIALLIGIVIGYVIAQYI